MAERIDENGIVYIDEPTSSSKDEGDTTGETGTTTTEGTTVQVESGESEEDSPITIDDKGLVTVHGNTYVDGNLEAAGQITGNTLEIREKD